MSNITIILCNFNYDKYLLDAIKSCESQTVKPHSVCIIDDASTDNSWSIIQKFVDKKRTDIASPEVWEGKKNGILYSAIRLSQTGGPSLARNIGIDLTHGYTDLYQILDADDYMYPTKLEKLQRKLEEHLGLGVAYADYDIFNIHTGNLIREYKEPYTKRRLLEDCIVHSGAMVKKEAILAVKDPFGYYDVNMRTCEDYDLWLRISEKYMIAHVPEALTFVRVHNNNSTNSVRSEVWQANWQRIREKLQARNR